MDADLLAQLDELYRDGQEHDAAQADRLARRRNLEPDSAAFLRLLVRVGRLRSVLEIGTSNGYSTLWLADAVRETGGRVLSVDTDAGALGLAAANLARAGLDGRVELRVEDGGATLAATPAGSVELLFLDSERGEYVGWWPAPLDVLAPHGVLVIDNVLSHPDEVAEVRALIDADERLTSVLVPTGKGQLLVTWEAR
jgi:predicted O-methyltransferase YrrM